MYFIDLTGLVRTGCKDPDSFRLARVRFIHVSVDIAKGGHAHLFFASRTVPSSSSSSSEEGLIRAIIPSLTIMSTKTNPSLSPDGFVVRKATSGVPFEDETEFRTSSVFVPLSSAKDNKTTGTLAFLTVYDEVVLSGGFIHAAALMITRACLSLCVRSLSFSHAHKTSSKLATFFCQRTRKKHIWRSFLFLFLENGTTIRHTEDQRPLPGRRLKTSKSEEEKEKNLLNAHRGREERLNNNNNN